MATKTFTRVPTSFKTLPAVLNMEEACCLLRVCDLTVVKMIKNGQIKGNRAGKQWFIYKDSIESFVKGEV